MLHFSIAPTVTEEINDMELVKAEIANETAEAERKASLEAYEREMEEIYGYWDIALDKWVLPKWEHTGNRYCCDECARLS